MPMLPYSSLGVPYPLHSPSMDVASSAYGASGSLGPSSGYAAYLPPSSAPGPASSLQSPRFVLTPTAMSGSVSAVALTSTLSLTAAPVAAVSVPAGTRHGASTNPSASTESMMVSAPTTASNDGLFLHGGMASDGIAGADPISQARHNPNPAGSLFSPLALSKGAPGALLPSGPSMSLAPPSSLSLPSSLSASVLLPPASTGIPVSMPTPQDWPQSPMPSSLPSSFPADLRALSDLSYSLDQQPKPHLHAPYSFLQHHIDGLDVSSHGFGSVDGGRGTSILSPDLDLASLLSSRSISDADYTSSFGDQLAHMAAQSSAASAVAAAAGPGILGARGRAPGRDLGPASSSFPVGAAMDMRLGALSGMSGWGASTLSHPVLPQSTPPSSLSSSSLFDFDGVGVTGLESSVAQRRATNTSLLFGAMDLPSDAVPGEADPLFDFSAQLRMYESLDPSAQH
jgi:hypothetical protein